jgi:integrase
MSREALTLGRAISLWEGSLRAQMKAPSTIKSYVRSVEYLEEAFGRDCDPASVTTEDIELVMSKWHDLSPTTARNRLIAIREFYKWGGKRRGWPDPTLPLDIPRRDKPQLRRLTVAEVTAILDAPVSERMHLWVMILAYTAGRIDELRHRQWQDVDLIGRTMVLPHDQVKGRRGREIPLAEPLLEALARSKDERGRFADDTAYLIPARRRAQFIPEDEATLWYEPASQMSLGRMLKATARVGGVRAPAQITAHMFRRYTLEHIVEEHGLYVGAALAGHQSIQTTADYGGGASLERVAKALANTRLRDISETIAAKGKMGVLGFEPRLSTDSDDPSDESEPGDRLVTGQDAS